MPPEEGSSDQSGGDEESEPANHAMPLTSLSVAQAMSALARTMSHMDETTTQVLKGINALTKVSDYQQRYQCLKCGTSVGAEEILK